MPRRGCRGALASACRKSPPPLAAQVKRVIGIPGDVVEVRGGVMLLNGQPRYEPYHPAGVKWCLASTTAARHISPAWLP